MAFLFIYLEILEFKQGRQWQNLLGHRQEEVLLGGFDKSTSEVLARLSKNKLRILAGLPDRTL